MAIVPDLLEKAEQFEARQNRMGAKSDKAAAVA
jgi:hypothetical protein